MTAKARRWRVRLAAAAEADFCDIVRWTTENFGERQARVYATTLRSAFEALTAGPRIIGVKARDDIAPGLMTLHVARQSRRGRHLIIFRIGNQQDQPAIDILRLLHDSMDLPQHQWKSDESPRGTS